MQKFIKIKIQGLENCQDFSFWAFLGLLILTKNPQIARPRFSVKLNPSFNDFDLMWQLILFCRSHHLHKIPASQSQIARKKEELTSKISNKLEILRAELANLKSESKSNEEIGRQITVKVMQVAQPNECEKYKLHVEEIDKITSLLHGLAGRLARADNTYALCSDASEKVSFCRSYSKI